MNSAPRSSRSQNWVTVRLVLLPRLPVPAARLLLEESFEGQRDGQEPSFPPFDWSDLPEQVRFAPTGGRRATAEQMHQLRDDVVKLASDAGRQTAARTGDLALFDSEIAAYLREQELFSTGEALRDDVWAFVGVVLAPDIVWWRFGKSRERYLGGVRNTFQRLWHRGRVLDRGEHSARRWGLVDGLTEDAFVQIMERPSLGANPKLARGLAEAWIRAAERFGRGPMEPLMRHATVQVRIQNEIRSLSWLPDADLAHVIDQAFRAAASHYGI